MNEINVKDWDEFEAKLTEFESLRQDMRQKTPIFVSPFLFRGQGNAKWRLTSTLERFTERPYSLIEYYRAIRVSKAQIETFTRRQWALPPSQEYEEWVRKGTFLDLTEWPAYEYMIYLRHHGFPSPLLDWTQSPYVAAFFAFRSCQPLDDHVSIFAFLEHCGHGKSFCSKDPYILSLGPNVRSHERHFLQQSEYTVCLQWQEADAMYACHQNAFSMNNEQQDLLWKINIPSSEKLRVLRRLDRFNLNSFSLFGSEESLMETVATRIMLFTKDEL